MIDKVCILFSISTRNLILRKESFAIISKLENFPFDENLLASKSKGKFPDLSIKMNKNSTVFTGGELIELKDSKNYTVSSFNSTIPTGRKGINEIIKGKESTIRRQIQKTGDIYDSLPIREVFYLIRGRKKMRTSQKQKITLVHGSFFETVPKEELISQSFLQALEERAKQANTTVKPEFKALMSYLFSQQESFSKVRNIDKASIKLRFRIMTEVKAEGNILNSNKYPEILDNTLNLVLPYHNEEDRISALKKMKIVFSKEELKKVDEFKIRHHFNGNFLIFQTKLLE